MIRCNTPEPTSAMRAQSTPYLARLFQVAYVTTDLDEALPRIRATTAVRDFATLEMSPVIEYRGCKVSLSARAALAWTGNTMIEVIEPRGDEMAVWRHGLGGDGFRMAFHHLGVFVDDYEAARDEVLLAGHSIAVEGEIPGMARFLYLDHTATLGHFVEHVWLSGAGHEFFAGLPRATMPTGV